MASILLKNITKRYPGNVVAVHDFNLEVEDKEFVILVGPSGCGKSTTLRMIAGLEDISGGELYIGDRLVNDVAPKDRDIAMVFQNYALYPHMTVYKNMAFSLEMKKVDKKTIHQKVLEAAKILDIEHLLERKPKALSGGQRQRVALGRAMVRNPAVFLLDEPLSNLDAKLRSQMRAEIVKLHLRLGTTFVYVTHDQVEAMTMGDRIVVMKDGLIKQVDTPQNLFDYPANLFVATFIGTPQMNMLHAVLVEDARSFALQIAENRIPIPENKAPADVLRSYVGKEVIAGIRAENISDDPNYFEAMNLPILDARVDMMEMLGAEVYLTLECANTKLTAKVPSHTKAKLDSQIRIGLDVNRLHLFDKETELTIFN